MTKIAISPNANGTGTFTLAAPDSNTNRTLTLPDAGGEVLTDTSDIEAQVKTATSATGTAPIYACRAWVNFDGTGTVAIRASGNVSSITDNGTGDYTVNFTTAMPDTNYSWQINTGTQEVSFASIRGGFNNGTAPSTNSLRVNIKTTTTGANFDMAAVTVAIFR